MKNQKGFTLVELMVVMAIIAILGTTGISRYLGYTANARDTIRVGDTRNFETLIAGMMSTTGSAPDETTLEIAIKTQNNGELVQDPSKGGTKCLDAAGDKVACEYSYAQCDDGYILRVNFEANTDRYTNDDIKGSPDVTFTPSADFYEFGYCDGVVGAFTNIDS